MPFTFKLSVRLALIKASLATLAAAVVAACEMPGRRVTDPSNSPVVQVIVSPDAATLDPSQTRQFLTFGRTQAGDSVAVNVAYSATGGTISTNGLYTAGTSAGSYRVMATGNGGLLADTSAITIVS
ncbi:MAG: hypothetical protein ACREMI_08705, partial [Gemmatimonadales bacterium]